jgi:caa(3)-type oxidase subunit IV
MHGPSTATLARIWAALVALTLLEVVLAFPQFSPILFLVILLALSVGKSAMIIAWFMHMKLAGRSLALLLFPLLIVFVICLLGILPDARQTAVRW